MQMKGFFLCILLFSVSLCLFSEEMNAFSEGIDTSTPSYRKIDFDLNLSLRFMFPFPEYGTLILLDFSAGMGYGIIPGYWYIGAAADAALGLDWFLLFSDEEESSDPDREYNQFGISLGARIYSEIRLTDSFRIRPFFGCDFLFILSPMLYAGMEASVHIAGLEYAYYFSTESDNPIRHQISLKIHIPQE